MSQPDRREYAALAAISGSSGMNLLIPLYLSHLGYPVGLVGLLAGLGALTILLSRIPVPMLYRPQRSRTLLLVAAAGGMVTSIALPFLADLTLFSAVLMVNRALSGLATAVYLARYLDMIAGGTDRRRAMGNYGGIQAAGYTASGVFVGSLADFLGYPAAFFFGAAMSALGGALLLGAPNPAPRRPPQTATARPQAKGGLHARLSALADPGLWLVLNANTWNQGFQVLQASFLPVLATAVGLGPAQVGIVRAVYSGINMVGRPTAGVFLGRLSLRQVAYLGLAVQAVPLFALPFLSDFVPFILLSLTAGFGRAIIVVAASTGLAEEVDETRVSRGTATAAYSTSNDVPNVIGPLVVGATASAIGLAYMFPVVAIGIVAGFTAGDLAVARWRLRRAARPVSLSGAT